MLQRKGSLGVGEGAVKPPEVWTLIIRAEPGGKDVLGRAPSYRLRLLLKLMLRGFGFRVVHVRPEEGSKREIGG